jgi:hypothetical protein
MQEPLVSNYQTLAASHLCRLVCLVVLLSSRISLGGFTDVTATVMPDLASTNQLAWGDYDNDGFVDLSFYGTLLRNNGAVNFSVPTLEPGSRLNGSPNVDGLWGDHDNDGWLDFYAFSAQELYHNNSGNSFSVADFPSLPTQLSRGASWADHDNDGYLDLYTGGYEIPDHADYSDIILHNNLGAGFSNTWTQPTPRPGRGITSADFDRDGDIDVYVSNYRLLPNQLQVNDGSGSFSEQAGSYGVQGGVANGHWGHTIGSAWGDINNDGEIDLFVGNFAHDAGYSGPQRQPESRFLRNRGPAQGYTFEDMGQGGVGWQESYASPALGDYDNDGDLDLFFTTVYAVASGGISNFPRLYRNDGNWNFTDVTASEGLSGIRPTYQAAFADYDNDGDLDLATGGTLFRNDTLNSHHWLKLKMVGDGDTVNRDAVGTQVRITSGGQTFMRQVEFGTGEGNQNEPTLHFGLGNIVGPVDLDILWPGGTTSQIADVPLDQLHLVHFSTATDYTWNTSGGSWHNSSSWSPEGVPNGNDNTAEFAGAGSSVTTVTVDSPVTMREITLDGSSSYQLEGEQPLKLDATTGTAQLIVTGGTHTWTTPVTAETQTSVEVHADAELTLAGRLDFENQQVIKSGSGRLYLDSGFTAQAGTLQHDDGMLGGNGVVNGNLTVGSAAVAPGHDLGQLTVTGEFTMGSNSTLEIEIGGASAGKFDTLHVDQSAYLDGTLSVTLTDNFFADLGEQFPIVQSTSVANRGITLGGPDAGKFKLVFGAGQLLLESIAPPPPTDYQWVASSSLWHNPTNWSPTGIPNKNNHRVAFADAGSPVTAVQIDSPTTVREITLDGTSSYQLEGDQMLTLTADTGSAQLNVTAGNHRWTTPVTAAASTTVNIAPGAELTLEGLFNFENQIVTKSGAGRLYLDSGLALQTGTFQHDAGLLGGEGIVNGDVTVDAATVGPGHSIGTLTVKGDFTMGSESVLEIEIGGISTGQFDTLEVLQNAYLRGQLAVTLTDNYYPDLGEQFSILEAGSIANYGVTLDGPDADKFKLVFTTGQLLLESTIAGLPGDYNNDGTVDAADYTLWRDTLGQTGVNLAADGHRDGVVNQVDYDYWKTRFSDSIGGNGSSNIPEPVAWVIMIQLAVIWTLVSRNRCWTARGSNHFGW